jgi:hypothetical protein
MNSVIITLTNPKCSAAIHRAPQAGPMLPFAGKPRVSAEWFVPPLGLPFTVELPARNRGWEGGNGSGDASSAISARVTEAQCRADTPGNRWGGPFSAIVGVMAGSR